MGRIKQMWRDNGSWAVRGRARSGRAALTIAVCVAAAVAFAAAVTAGTRASAADDVFQQAVNYVFTGRVDPPESLTIIDRKNCVVEMQDPRFKRYARYYLGRFKLDAARFNKRYSGPRAVYDIDVQGDDVILEYLAPDKTTVLQAYKSAQIALPGDFDSTQKALKIISDSCKAEGPKAPF